MPPVGRPRGDGGSGSAEEPARKRGTPRPSGPGGGRAHGRRRTPTKGDRREQALLDAMEAVLAGQSLPRVSIDQIAARAGVGRTAFYFYFASKEAALAALVERSLAAIWQDAGPWLLGDGDEPARDLERGLRGLVDAWAAHGHLLRAVVEAASWDAEIMALWSGQIESFAEVVAKRISRDAERGLARVDDPRETAEALCWMNERYCYVRVPPGASARIRERVTRQLSAIWRATLYGG